MHAFLGFYDERFRTWRIKETDINPVESDHFYRRPSIEKMQEATFGIALYDENDELKITWCNEVIETKSCSNETDEEDEKP